MHILLTTVRRLIVLIICCSLRNYWNFLWSQTLFVGLLGRPTYTSADLSFTTDFLSFFFIFSPSNFRAGWTELNQNQPCWEVRAIWKRMSKIWGIPSPYKSGAQKLPFWTTSQLNGNFNGLHLWNETRYRQPVSAFTTTGGMLHRRKISSTLVHKWLQTGPPFLPTLCKFCFLRHCQASQTEISKQNSTKLCQTADGKSR